MCFHKALEERKAKGNWKRMKNIQRLTSHINMDCYDILKEPCSIFIDLFPNHGLKNLLKFPTFH